MDDDHVRPNPPTQFERIAPTCFGANLPVGVAIHQDPYAASGQFVTVGNQHSQQKGAPSSVLWRSSTAHTLCGMAADADAGLLSQPQHWLAACPSVTADK
jgi:hypothetical protein